MRPQKRWINQGKFPLDRPSPGIPETHAEHLRVMLDIFVLAFWSDTTRIGTFMLGDAQSAVDYSFLPGVKGSFHTLSHHGDIPATRDQYEKIINWNVEQMAYFLNRMKSLDEGGTSLLDNSMVMFGGTIKDGNRHTRRESSAAAGRARERVRCVRAAVCARRRRRRSAISICRCSTAWA